MGSDVTKDVLEKRIKELETALLELYIFNDNLNEKNNRYRSTIRHVSDIVFTHDLEGNYLETDMPEIKSKNNLSGYNESDLTGKNVAEFLPQRLKHGFSDYLERIKSNGSDEGTMIFETKDKEERYIWYSNSIQYENGKQIVRGIARDITESIQAKRMLRANQELLAQVVEGNSIPTFVINEDHEIIFWNHACELLTGIYASEIKGTRNHWKAFYTESQPTLADLVLSQASKKEIRKQFGNKFYQSRNIPGAYQCEKYFSSLGGSKGKWLFLTAAPLKNHNGETTGAIETLQDITGRKLAETELARAHASLEKKVKQRTRSLQEANTALKVLLKKRDDDKKELEGKMLFNIRELVMPFVEMLKNGSLSEKQKLCVEMVETNLNEVISPFIHGASFDLLRLTPSEIQIANLIKQGKSSKDIARALNLSSRTVDFHRDNIRKKLNINGKKINLRSYLISSE